MNFVPKCAVTILAMGFASHSYAQNYTPINLSNTEIEQYQIISDELWVQLGKPAAPPYPNLSKMAGFSGPVDVFMEIDNTGNVIKSDFRKSSAYHPSLAPMALSWCKKLKFPATSTPDSVNRKYVIFVVFSKSGTVEIQPTLNSHFK